MGSESGAELIALLERCGLSMVSIPAGRYQVGLDLPDDAIFARPPKWIIGAAPRLTAPALVEVGAFWMAREPLRLSHLEAFSDQGAFAIVGDLIDADERARAAARRDPSDSVDVEPTFDALQYAFAADEPKPTSRAIPRQPVLDPVLELEAPIAAAVAAALGGRLPVWHEWEVAVRGSEGWRYPWGDEVDLAALSLERQDYSIDDESTMGYYSYDQEFYLVHSFGRYAEVDSPFGLRGLARAGREWNRSGDGEPTEEPYILRSLSDLGAMAHMIPGIRPNTVGLRGWRSRAALAYSGPVAAAWAAPGDVFDRAGVRLVVPAAS